MADVKETPAAPSKDPQTAAENPKVVVPSSAKIPDAMKSDAPQPAHPSLGQPDPVTGDAELDAAKARALQELPDDDQDEDFDDSAPTNIGKPVGKPIKSVVRKKMYADDGRIYEQGKLYYLQLYEGQTYPSDVLEPVDAALAKKYRIEFKKNLDAKQARIREQQRARDDLLLGLGR